MAISFRPRQPKQKTIQQIKLQAGPLKLINDEQLAQYTDKYRRAINGGISLDELVIEAFAVVRETARRTLGMEHRDNQILGAIELYHGKIIELGNGEGKTLLSTMPVYLHAISGFGVHVATYNEYLAQRDALWMGQIYSFLGLSVGVILPPSSAKKLVQANGELQLQTCSRQEAYASDITYGTYPEFAFDYLRDHMNITSQSQKKQRGLNYALLDEADSVLVDLGRTPCVIATSTPSNVQNLIRRAYDCAREMIKDEDFTINGDSIIVTAHGLSKAEKKLEISNIFSEDFAGYVYQIEQSLNALHLQTRDRDYFVRNGSIYSIDNETGRARLWTSSESGLLPAIQIKENVGVTTRASRVINEISYQQYFKLYKRLAGMSATAVWREREIQKVYNIEVSEIPPFKPIQRKDLSDLIFKSPEIVDQACLHEIIRIHENGNGRPLLIDAIEVDRAKKLSRMLNLKNIPHNVLTADNDDNEAHIIENAGQVGSVTVTAKMAGRGTDIQISEEAERLGGLHVIGLERLGQKHRDMQLRGRAGRQGKPGTSQFIISVQDELMKRSGGQRVLRFMQWADLPDDEAIEHQIMSASITRAQRRVENSDAKIRQRVYEYDAILQKQRQYIFDVRDRILIDDDLTEDIQLMIENLSKRSVTSHIIENKEAREDNVRFTEHAKHVSQICPLISEDLLVGVALESPDYIIDYTHNLLLEALKRLTTDILGEHYFRIAAPQYLLVVLDQEWQEHLAVTRQLITIAGLRSNPLDWYIAECNANFMRRLQVIEDKFLSYLFSSRIDIVQSVAWS